MAASSNRHLEAVTATPGVFLRELQAAQLLPQSQQQQVGQHYHLQLHRVNVLLRHRVNVRLRHRVSVQPQTWPICPLRRG